MAHNHPIDHMSDLQKMDWVGAVKVVYSFSETQGNESHGKDRSAIPRETGRHGRAVDLERSTFLISCNDFSGRADGEVLGEAGNRIFGATRSGSKTGGPTDTQTNDGAKPNEKWELCHDNFLSLWNRCLLVT